MSTSRRGFTTSAGALVAASVVRVTNPTTTAVAAALSPERKIMGGIHVPARFIPTPKSISSQAQAVLDSGGMAEQPSPPPNDHEAWRKFIAAKDAAVLPMIQAMAATVPADVSQIQTGEARTFVVRPHSVSKDDRAVFLDIHGGGLTMGSGELCRAFAIGMAGRIQAHVWSVDYRMPPDHQYPAALDDCLAAYRALLRERNPEEIVIGGGSAGGNLAAATVLRARDEGLPLPAAVFLGTPELDLTESGDSFQTNLGVDTILRGSLMSDSLLYAGGHDLSHPYLSPLFGDFTKGFPPTFLSTGRSAWRVSNGSGRRGYEP